jgi:hypothetical protein
MEDRRGKLLGVMQMDDRGFKERLIGAIFRPSIMPFIHVRVMEFMALRFQLIPLNARMKDLQNIVKDFIERKLRLWSCFGSLQMRINISVKVSTRDFRWNPMVDERRG